MILTRLLYLTVNRQLDIEASTTAISNSSLSSLIGTICYYQDRDMSIDYFSSTSFSSGNVTGRPQGMAGTAFAGGTFSSGDQMPAFEHVFLSQQMVPLLNMPQDCLHGQVLERYG